MTKQKHNYQVACGMYAFTEPLRHAWQALIKPFGVNLNAIAPSTPVAEIDISFEHGNAAIQLPSLLLGHTCGYPYVTRWYASHRLVCVPEFDIDGCRGAKNCSWIVSNAGNPGTDLADFKEHIAAVNTLDSNSGMNVFRHTMMDQARDGKFFSKVRITGGHLASLRAVATGQADIAAIDPVSYHHCLKLEPALANKTRIIGHSVYTMGLPFITPKAEPIARDALTMALNQCLDQTPEQERRLLRIRRFTAVTDSQYREISELESTAVRAGYPLIN